MKKQVGSFPPNAFGLYDMHGNVRDWVADGYHENYTNAPNDGKIWIKGADEKKRVSRGGSWFFNPVKARSAYRDFGSGGRSNLVGFRVVGCV